MLEPRPGCQHSTSLSARTPTWSPSSCPASVQDLDITMEDGLLTIQGERHFANDSSEEQFHRVERRYGARRSITLPAHVMAGDPGVVRGPGVLQILVPKAEEAKPKRIQVRRSSQDP